MKKFAKISLVAAVAVAGLTTANAQPLEEAIKGVDVSGYATYRFDNGDNADTNAYKVGLGLKSKVANDFSVNFSGAFRKSETAADTTSVQSSTFDLSNISFTYTGVKDLTVIAGRQSLNTPWTEGSSTINGTDLGNGVLGLYNAGFATIAAGHFTSNNIDVDANSALAVKDSDLNVAAVIVPLASIGATAQAWMIQVGEAGSIIEDTHAESYNLAGKVANVSYDVRYSTLTLNDGDENSLLKATASTNVAGVDLTVGYGKTGDKGGIVAFDNDGAAAFGVEIANLNNLTDAKAYLVAGSYSVLPSVTLSASYLDVSVGNTDASELDASLSYAASKNMTASVVYANYNADINTDDSDLTRVELAYKF